MNREGRRIWYDIVRSRYGDLPKVKASLITRYGGTATSSSAPSWPRGVLFSGLPNYEEGSERSIEVARRANSILQDSDPINIDWLH